MGVYDRDYYREDSRGGSFWSTNSVVHNLVLLNAAVFFIDFILLRGVLSEWGGLRSDLWRTPWNVWQLWAYGFLHHDLGHVLFNMLGLYFFGRDIEERYGRAEFLRLYLALVALAGLGWLVGQLASGEPGRAVLIGASGAVVGIGVLFALHFPKRLIYVWGVIPVPAWLLIGIYVVGDLMMAMRPGEGGNVAYTAHLTGAFLAFLYFHFQISLGRWWPAWPTNRRRRWWGQPQLKVYQDQAPDSDGVDLVAEMDKVLDKIRRSGEASLTAEERQLLEDASRRYRQRRRV